MTQEQPTLRDQFAMAALTGLLGERPIYHNDQVIETAIKAYELADAMVIERGSNDELTKEA